MHHTMALFLAVWDKPTSLTPPEGVFRLDFLMLVLTVVGALSWLSPCFCMLGKLIWLSCKDLVEDSEAV